MAYLEQRERVFVQLSEMMEDYGDDEQFVIFIEDFVYQWRNGGAFFFEGTDRMDDEQQSLI